MLLKYIVGSRTVKLEGLQQNWRGQNLLVKSSTDVLVGKFLPNNVLNPFSEKIPLHLLGKYLMLSG